MASVESNGASAATPDVITSSSPIEMQTKIIDGDRPDFIKQGRAVAFLDHEVFIAVKQLNMDVMATEALNRNTPGHPDYRKWLSFEEVNAIRGNAVGRQAIADWLTANGVEITWTAVTGNYMKAKTTIGHWETLLSTTFYMYQDQKYGSNRREIPRADRYFLPSSIFPHVHDFFGVSELPATITRYGMIKDGKQQQQQEAVERGYIGLRRTAVDTTNMDTAAASSIAVASSSTVAVVDSSLLPDDSLVHTHRRLSSSCSGQSTVSCLDSIYNVASNLGDVSATQAVFETSNEAYSSTDLTDFQETYHLTVQNAEDVNGYDVPVCNTADDNDSCFEGNLDIQYIMGMAQITTSTYYHVSDEVDPFLTYLTDLSNMTNPYMVNSISWGSPEQENTAAVLDSFNNEAMTLAARGVTVMVSSGDNGAPGISNCPCNVNTGSDTLNKYPPAGGATWSGTGYFPSFPATSPYVTAVGATAGPNSNDPLIACQSQEGGIITTGGGFSTYYEAPSWQTAAIANYFSAAEAAGTTPSSGYSPMGRGYPDVAMLGTNFPVIINGKTYSLYGTSASSPLFASFVSLLNALRLMENSTSTGNEGVGWLNPLLWEAGNNGTFAGTNVAIFEDVTSGSNKCCANQVALMAVCCTSGFTTTTGWDPVTGWGSITYSNFVALYGYQVDDYTSSSSSNSSSGLGTVATALISVFAVLAVIVAALFLTGYFSKRQAASADNADTGKQQQLSNASRREAGAGTAAVAGSGAYVPPSAPGVVRMGASSNKGNISTTDSPMW